MNKVTQFEVYLQFMCQNWDDESAPFHFRHIPYPRKEWTLRTVEFNNTQNQFLSVFLTFCIVFLRLPRASQQILIFLTRKLIGTRNHFASPPPKHWNCGFQSRSRRGCRLRFSVFVFSSVDSGLATGLQSQHKSPINFL